VRYWAAVIAHLIPRSPRAWRHAALGLIGLALLPPLSSGLRADQLTLEPPPTGFAVGADSNQIVVRLDADEARQGLQFHVAFDPQFLSPVEVRGLDGLSTPRLHYSVSTPGLIRVVVYDREGGGWHLAAGVPARVAIRFAALRSPPTESISLALVHGLTVSDSRTPIRIPPSTIDVAVAPGESGVPDSETDAGSNPVQFRLGQSAPNPFSRSTSIHFDVPRRSAVRIAVYDVGGRLVRVLAHQSFEPGRHVVTWNPEGRGARTRPGLFFYVMEAEGYRAVKKMVRLE
jgi:hypothetical protein